MKYVTYPSFYCGSCGLIFRYKGKNKYAGCYRCRSKSKDFSYHDIRELPRRFEKLIVLCSRCNHIWKMKEDKLRKRTHCPKCKKHMIGKKFYYFFIHTILEKNDKETVKKILRERFPKKRYFIFK